MILAFGLAVLFVSIIGIYAILQLGVKGHEAVRQWSMGLRHLRGFLIQPGFFYHPGHTWIALEGERRVRVGLDDFGRRLVAGVHAVALPAKGSTLRRGRSAVELDCGKQRAAVLLSPVDGIVTSVNGALIRDGAALERDPYGKGWLFTAEVMDEDFTRLPTGEAALAWLEREAGRLSVFLHQGLGLTAADGGELIPRPSRALDADQWETLVRAFFETPGVDGPAQSARPEKGGGR
jgi:glycine cleavage system H lipoate-binding protein